MNSNVENLPPHVIRLVYKEVSSLAADPPEGVKIYPNEEDLSDLHASIEGPEGTPFAGGVFRMRLVLGKDFPASPPKGYFLTKIFHPNVGPSGEICVNVLKRDWRAELGIRHILLTIRCLLIHPNPESALNPEAGRLLLEGYPAFASRARLLTEIHAIGGGGGGGPRSPRSTPARGVAGWWAGAVARRKGGRRNERYADCEREREDRTGDPKPAPCTPHTGLLHTFIDSHKQTVSLCEYPSDWPRPPQTAFTLFIKCVFLVLKPLIRAVSMCSRSAGICITVQPPC
ncbi:ubiquitin-conjugating enzyme E2 S [Huso huso]|uniref:Ubiquitin-conjugating enzyme E2 S n=1 Tax=Huso huso TaxID=61971 RepID=A0ABR0Y865_HUSHU